MKAYDRLPFKLTHKSGNMRIVDKNDKVVMFTNYKQFQEMSQEEYDNLWSIIESMVSAGNRKNLEMKRELEAIDPIAIGQAIRNHIVVLPKEEDEPKSHFEFDGVNYEIEDTTPDIIILPDNRLLKVGFWGETYPNTACGLTLIEMNPLSPNFSYGQAYEIEK